MTELVRFESAEGSSLLVEVDDEEYGVTRVSRGRDGVVEAAQTLDEALRSTQPTVKAIVQSIRACAPDEFEIEFGMKLNAEAGVIVAKTALEGHFTVKLAWRRP
ncbi:CU044_2847 family protein [Kibdelosporangium persicum]|uniref:Trypsin-co-occurring domain-containing protein n=1 Tax=Kibdelosporangium persicum TaxID=2698649 RepID=A0ABX2FI97_9PSEU|nr:CU044_2847 family protein [Kibdelosporangium persicum]NRN71002.1 hypothetical protein [Kibdelosporangium persicum]